jgi:hypothetical protein
VDAGQEAYEQRYRARIIDHLKRRARVLGSALVQIEEIPPDPVSATV